MEGLILIQGISIILGLIALVCYIMTVVKMFQNTDSALGIASAVGFIVCGIGVLVAFIFGWIKVNDYENKTVMIVWTACIAFNLILSFAAGAMAPAALP